MPANRITITALSTSGQGTGVYGFFVPDSAIRPFNIGIGCVVSTAFTAATGTYTVQHTFDYTGNTSSGPNNFVSSGSTTVSPLGPGSSNPFWFNHSTLAGVSGSLDSNYAFPVTGIRLSVTSTSTSLTPQVWATFVQAG